MLVPLVLLGSGCGDEPPPREPVQCAQGALYGCWGVAMPPPTDTESMAFCLPWRRHSVSGVYTGYGSSLTSFVYEGDRLVEITAECGYDSPDGLFRFRRSGDGTSTIGWTMDPWKLNPTAEPRGYEWVVELDAIGRPVTGAILTGHGDQVFEYTPDGRLDRVLLVSYPEEPGDPEPYAVNRVNQYRWGPERLERIEGTDYVFDQEWDITYEYDDGRLVASRATTFEQTHTWEEGLLVESHGTDMYSGEHTIRNEYSDEGRLVTQRIDRAGLAPASELFITYDEQGRPATMELIGYDRDYFTDGTR